MEGSDRKSEGNLGLSSIARADAPLVFGGFLQRLTNSRSLTASLLLLAYCATENSLFFLIVVVTRGIAFSFRAFDVNQVANKKSGVLAMVAYGMAFIGYINV